MPGSKNRRKGRRGTARRADSVPRPVVAMTPQESFERQLAMHTDSTNIRGKFVGTVSLPSATPTALFLIQPSTLGARVASISSDYLRWRVKSLRIRFLGEVSGTGNGGGFTSMGVLDDVNYAGEPPTSVSGVAELRCSASTFTSQTIPVNFDFRPLDPKRWYYCTSVSNDRFDSVGTLYAGTSGSGTAAISYEVDFSIVFSGAYTVGAL